MVGIGPFPGTLDEEFESQALQGPSVCVAERVLEGNAVLDVFDRVTSRSGQQMLHTLFMTEFTFAEPVLRFGGYFGSA